MVKSDFNNSTVWSRYSGAV